jgi:DNA processing protein
VVVVEGAAKSGSLITARNALDQGRDVMAVPGSPLDARAAGCNMLIRDGATLVRGARDVLEVIEAAKPNAPNEVEAAPVPPVPNPDANALRKQLLDLIGTTPIAEDALIQDLSAPTQSIVALLSELELMGEIERLPGGAIARKMSETG